MQTNYRADQRKQIIRVANKQTKKGDETFDYITSGNAFIGIYV